LNIEALILNDISNEEEIENINNHNNQKGENINNSKKLINKWLYLANLSGFDELKNLIVSNEIINKNENNDINISAAITSSMSSSLIFQNNEQQPSKSETMENILIDTKNSNELVEKNKSEEQIEIINATATINNTQNKISSILDLNKDTLEVDSEQKTQIDLMSSSIIELKNTVETEKSLQSNINNSCNPNIFLNCLEKLHKSLQVVDKHLENIQKSTKEFYDFEKQHLKLNSIKDALESLSTALKTSIKHKKIICEKANKDLNKNITKILNELTKEHQVIVKKYKEKDVIYAKNFDLWKEFHKDFEKINEWLNTTLDRLSEFNKSVDNDRIEEIIRDFSNLTTYRLLLERTNLNGNEILRKSHENEAKSLNNSLMNLNKTWKSLISSLNDLKEKQINKTFETQIHKDQVTSKSSLSEFKTSFEDYNSKLNDMNAWILKGQNLSRKQISTVDELENERLILELNVRCTIKN
jgi:hypothetical protein